MRILRQHPTQRDIRRANVINSLARPVAVNKSIGRLITPYSSIGK